ncbi:uncharacterized protein LOC125758050 [Rhipicephalus sanguineus]|uniref:uncharacterized protein LOC125758050 n=1 Tax=Rhipicephalus sanguineus TaxID=34632 RepID=UPI0020C4ADC4|nr:uncharacterized protein LOC125758050 [Rhipicephalus sanguineus]
MSKMQLQPIDQGFNLRDTNCSATVYTDDAFSGGGLLRCLHKPNRNLPDAKLYIRPFDLEDVRAPNGPSIEEIGLYMVNPGRRTAVFLLGELHIRRPADEPKTRQSIILPRDEVCVRERVGAVATDTDEPERKRYRDEEHAPAHLIIATAT